MAEQRRTAENLVLLDTGDAWVGGGELGDLTRGEVIVRAMNMLRYDAMALGAKELTLGAEELSGRLAEAEFAVVSANAVHAETGAPVVPGYTFIDRDGFRIGVIGLTRSEDPSPQGFAVKPPVPALRTALAEVQKQTSVAILLTDIGLDQAQEIARQVPDIDLVVGSVGAYVPPEAIHVPGTGTLAVTAEMPAPRHTGRRVGRLEVTLEPDGTMTGESWVTRSLDETLADDSDMARLLGEYALE